MGSLFLCAWSYDLVSLLVPTDVADSQLFKGNGNNMALTFQIVPNVSKICLILLLLAVVKIQNDHEQQGCHQNKRT